LQTFEIGWVKNQELKKIILNKGILKNFILKKEEKRIGGGGGGGEGGGGMRKKTRENENKRKERTKKPFWRSKQPFSI